MTLLPKSATISGTINLGNYDNFRFEFGAEIASTEDYLGLVEFAASSLIGQFRNADETTQATVRAYVARLCSIEEAQVPCMQQPAPEPAKAPAPLPTPEPAKPAPQPATTAPAPKPAAPEGEVCEGCGAPVTKSQAKLSQMFMSKTLCKTCMDQTGGV